MPASSKVASVIPVVLLALLFLLQARTGTLVPGPPVSAMLSALLLAIGLSVMILSWGRIAFRLTAPRTASPLLELILGTAFCGHVLMAADFVGLGILPVAAGLLGVGVAGVLWSERARHALPPPDWRRIALFALAIGYALAWTWSMLDQYDRYLGGGPYPFWADDFVHAGTINEYGDARSQGRGTLSLADQPRFVYHYASYTLPALAGALFDVSGLDAKVLVWMPLSIAMMMAGLAALGVALGGIQGGVLALLLLCLLPDAAAYGLQNGWYSFHWLVESSPGTGYSVGAGCASLVFLACWAEHRRRSDLIAGVVLLLSMFLLRAHVMIWLIPPVGMLLVLGIGSYRMRNRLIVLAGIAVLGLVAMVALSWQALQTDATDFVTKYMTWVHQANIPMAYEGVYAGLVEDLGRLGALPIGLGLALLAFTGVLLIGFAVMAVILWRQGRLSLIDSVPFALLATAFLMMVLAPTPWHGDYTDFRHRAFPLAVIVLIAWHARFAVLLCAGRPGLLRTMAAPGSLVAVAVTLLIPAWFSADWRSPRSTWALPYSNFETPGIRETARHIRARSTREDTFVIARSPKEWAHDDATMILGATGVAAFISRPLIHMATPGPQATLAQARLDVLAEIDATPDRATAMATLREHGITWYLVRDPGLPAWDPEHAEADFRAGPFATYRVPLGE